MVPEDSAQCADSSSASTAGDSPVEKEQELNNRSQVLVTALMVFGALVFGMILAGGLELTQPSHTAVETEASSTTAQRVEAHATKAIGSFADLAEAVLPAVVAVQATTIEEADVRQFAPFFLDPRRQQQQPFDSPNEFRSDGAGSGFVISEDGWIVTNNHVVEGAESVEIEMNDGQTFEAEVKGVDPATDLAVLKIKSSEPLPYLSLGTADTLRVGDWVMAIGNPFRLASSVTVGVVSAKGRSIGISSDSSFENFIQTDAAINRGNSGGPLVNTAGEVVGINTAMNFGAENIGFSVPVDTLRQILPQLRDEGRVRRGYLGVRIENLDPRQQRYYQLDESGGALVIEVMPGTPAAAADLEAGDVILEVDGRPVVQTRDLIDYVSAQRPGSTVALDLIRDGDRIQRDVKLRERGDDSQEEAGEDAEAEEGNMTWLGLEFGDLSRELRRERSIPRRVEGVVVVDVSVRSPLYEENVRAGDVISEVNGQPVSTLSELDSALDSLDTGEVVRFRVWRIGSNGQASPYFAFAEAP